MHGNQTHLDVVDPYQVRTVQSDGVSSPDILGIQLRDVDVLDDDVAGSSLHIKSLSLDDTARADSDERLVGFDNDRIPGGWVVRDRYLGCRRLFGFAPL